MVSWRLPGGLWGARGAQVPQNLIFKRFWGPLEDRFWVQNSLKHRLKFELQSSIAFDQHFGPSGGLLGRFWESFLDDFGMLFGCPSGKRKFMKNRTALTREHHLCQECAPPLSESTGKQHDDRRSCKNAHGAFTRVRFSKLAPRARKSKQSDESKNGMSIN